MSTLCAIDVGPALSLGGDSAAIGIVEPVQLSIGYSLLHNFKTVRDLTNQTIYLVESYRHGL